jgi:hypothetical protein
MDSLVKVTYKNVSTAFYAYHQEYLSQSRGDVASKTIPGSQDSPYLRTDLFWARGGRHLSGVFGAEVLRVRASRAI